jgi:hypothetical protein
VASGVAARLDGAPAADEHFDAAGECVVGLEDGHRVGRLKEARVSQALETNKNNIDI